MLPLIAAAFVGIGVTRLALMALELHDDEEAARAAVLAAAAAAAGGDEESSSGEAEDPEAAKARVVAAMAGMEKPARMIVRNDCQYICLWREADLPSNGHGDAGAATAAGEGEGEGSLSVDDLLRACAERQREAAARAEAEGRRRRLEQQQREEEEQLRAQAAGSVQLRELYRALQHVAADMTAFFDQLMVSDKTQLEQFVKPPSSTQLSQLAFETSPAPPTVRRQLQQLQQQQAAPQPPAPAASFYLKEQDEDEDEEDVCTDSACVVCYEGPWDAVFLSCGHGGTCFRCAVDVYRRSGECPLCRCPVQQIVTIGPRRATGPGGLLLAPVTGPHPALLAAVAAAQA